MEHAIVLCDVSGPQEVLTGFESWFAADEYLRRKEYKRDPGGRENQYRLDGTGNAYIIEVTPREGVW
jgi:hypothetical protein